MVTAIDERSAGQLPRSSILSPQGEELLSNYRSPDNRTAVAAYVGSAFAAGRLGAAEKKSAAAILELLSRDEDLKVRQAVCEQLLACSSIPTPIARILVRDVESIAVPTLRRAKTLSDEDLIETIRDGNTLKQVSIARRDIVSPIVSHELVATVKKTVVKTVLANDGADISEQSLLNVVADFGEWSSVQFLLIERAELPPIISRHLVSMVSGPMRERLVEQHHVPPQFIGDRLAKSRGSTLDPGLVARSSKTGSIVEPISILKTLCEGNFDFFVLRMASLAEVSASNARILINDTGQKGFSSLYAKTGLPQAFFTAFEIALDIASEVRKEGRAEWDDAATQRLIGRLRQAYGGVEGKSLDLILELLS